MSRIYWDSMLFIYFFEQNEKFGPRVREIENRMKSRGDTLCTSVLTFGEVLAGEHDSGEAVESIEEVISSVAEIIPIERSTMRRYAQLRGSHRFRTADAIHLACAAEAKTDLFLTNESALIGKIVPGIQFIAGLNTDIL